MTTSLIFLRDGQKYEYIMVVINWPFKRKILFFLDFLEVENFVQAFIKQMY